MTRDFCQRSAGVLLWLLVMGLAPPTCLGDAGDCRVYIEGESITKLHFQTESGDTLARSNPGSSVSLPAGRYWLQTVELEGNFQGYSYATSENGWFEIAADKPHRIIAGAPLTPTVTATRRGRIVQLDYALRDAADRNYSNSEYGNPPRFAVFKDGQQIGSGDFEYG